MALLRPWLLAVALSAGCVDAGEDDPADDLGLDDGKGDRGTSPSFYEVDATHSSAAFRTYIGKALVLLEGDDSQIARHTARSIRAGRVRVDELVDLTCWDFERVRAEIPDAMLEADDYARLHEARSPVARAITDEIDGYMWSNRIYVSRGMPVARLAATLVHETNHVINRSEVGYWDDFPTSAFVHEYRAFHAEAMFDPAPYDGVDLVDHVIELYELERDDLDPAVLAAPLTARLIPDDAAWRARKVSADPVDVAADCPGAR